jgi:putative YhdH/YhfP family quinone oxidoreductase
MSPATFRCFLVEKNSHGEVTRKVVERPLGDLPPGNVLIRVQFSSLNYKDALAAGAHPGVVRRLPHVPGIDAAGTVAATDSDRCQVGQPVVVTGYDLGAGQWGGWSEYIRVPESWVVPLPNGLSLRETMILGTAGFTAAQCVRAIELNGVSPGDGEIVVTGATGGVGCVAVKLLAQMGYTVVAVTGKRDMEPKLKNWGAARVIERAEVSNDSAKPLLSARWAGAVDTVGGQTLTTILRETKNYGVVAACGLVGGDELPLTVHPFILRGVTLAGIGSAALPYDRRLGIWDKLRSDWKPDNLEEIASTIHLEQLEEYVNKIQHGQIVGRTVVEL